MEKYVGEGVGFERIRRVTGRREAREETGIFPSHEERRGKIWWYGEA